MNADNRDELAPIFEAVITPHRSLPNFGFVVLMIGVGAVSFAAGMFFLILGAWPVFGFFGLDVLLLYWAFRINYRSAAAYEVVTVTPFELRVRKVSHHGRVREWALNPLWVRLEKITIEDFGIDRLLLVSRGKALQVASFLSPGEKASFAAALGNALADAKRGVASASAP
jgi:uncharacterized membrane protein